METEKTLIRSASLSEARRHESGARWLEASRAYLNTLVSEADLMEVALAGLKRCAQRTQSDFDDDSEMLMTSSVLLIVGYVVSGQWHEALTLCQQESDYVPSHLSASMQERWRHLQAKLNMAMTDENVQAPIWIALLQMIDVFTHHGYISDLLMMCRYTIMNISNPLHRALVCFESGRIGIGHEHYFSGGYLLAEAVSQAPNLFDDVTHVLDGAFLNFSQTLAIDDSAVTLFEQLDSHDELIALRCRSLSAQQIETWVSEMCHDPVSQANPHFSLWLGYRLEYLAHFQEIEVKNTQYVLGAFLAYALTLERAKLGRASYKEAFSRLVRLSLARKVQDKILDDDESTVDSQPHRPEHTTSELVEEGESRLLLQLKDHQRYELIISFLREKSEATHLSDMERARSYNALAQVSLSAKDGLRRSVEYAVKGAQLDARELKLSNLIRTARHQNDWHSLSPLLNIQLGLTKTPEKRLMIMKTIAQGERQQGFWLQSYQTLVKMGAEERSQSSSHTEPDQLNPFLLTFTEATEKEIASLLKVKGSALSIGHELISQTRWRELHRLLERLSMKGRVVLELLMQSVNQSTDAWIFAEPLLTHYANEEDWDSWLNLILTSPKRGWPTAEYGQLIIEAINRAKTFSSDIYSSLLRLRAEWLNEIDVSDEERIEAWSNYLDEHPADLSAIELLASSVERVGLWEVLAEAYERALPLRKTGKVRILKRLCDIYENHLDRLDLMADTQKLILELSPNNEEAGSWLTLYYAERKEWYQLSLTCALWSPDRALHPVWIEAKVRAHLGLEELDDAYYWWTLIQQESVRRLFIEPLLALAEKQKNGSFVLVLLALIEALEFDTTYQSIGDENLLIDEDTPPPVPSVDQSFSELDEEIDLEEKAHQLLSQNRYLKLKAQALSQWLQPVDLIPATQAWEQVYRMNKNDVEACYELTNLYSRLGRKKSLIGHLSFVEGEAVSIIENRRSVILGALNLETRFEEYTEAFKCWIALYEYSPADRERCMTAFHRLATKDHELSRLLMELLKLRAEHSNSQILSAATALEFVYLTSEKIRKWELAHAVIKNLVDHPIYSIEATWLMLRNTLPLGVWNDTIKVLSKSNHWRQLWICAHLAECRLGDHEWAHRLYVKASEAIDEQASKDKKVIPLHIRQSKLMIDGSIDRITEHLAISPSIESVIDIEFDTLYDSNDQEEADVFTFQTGPTPPPISAREAEPASDELNRLEFVFDEEALESVGENDGLEEEASEMASEGNGLEGDQEVMDEDSKIKIRDSKIKIRDSKIKIRDDESVAVTEQPNLGEIKPEKVTEDVEKFELVSTEKVETNSEQPLEIVDVRDTKKKLSDKEDLDTEETKGTVETEAGGDVLKSNHDQTVNEDSIDKNT